MKIREQVNKILWKARRDINKIRFFRGNFREGLNDLQRRELARIVFGLLRIKLWFNDNTLRNKKYNPLNYNLKKTFIKIRK